MKQINRISISYTTKSIVLFVFILSTSILAKAQPKPGVMIYGQFESNVSNNFVASVMSSDGKNFTCRFVQSNAVYVFKTNEPGEGTVISNKGGKYPAGSKFLFIEYNISDDTYGCIINRTQAHEIIAKFDDGKSYLGYAGNYKTDGSFTVGFWHSHSTYKFDKNGVVLSQSGGSYSKGSIAKIFCAELTKPLPIGIVLPDAQNLD